MTTRFYSSSGTPSAPYTDWATAATSLATALAACSSGDLLVIQYDGIASGDAELAADTTFTVPAGVMVVAGSNDGGSGWTYTVMGTANWIGNSTTNRSVTLDCAGSCFIAGLTLRTAGSTTDSLTIGSSDNSFISGEDVYLWNGNSATSSSIRLGASSTTNQMAVRLKNCTFRFGSTGQSISVRCKADIIGGSLSSAGSIPTSIFTTTTGTMPGGVDLDGFDFSALSTNELVGDCLTPLRVKGSNCKASSGFVPLGTQSSGNLSGAEVLLLNTASGDTHYNMIHATPQGSLVIDTGIYANDGATSDGSQHTTWKIVTTSSASYFNPYVSPWVRKYNSILSAITPYLEILRDGSATAYNDDQVWGEFAAQATSGSPLASFYSDRRGFAASAAAQATGVGTSGWTGEGGTAWSGKLAPTSSITPAEVGHLGARVCVGAASSTVYVDPLIRV